MRIYHRHFSLSAKDFSLTVHPYLLYSIQVLEVSLFPRLSDEILDTIEKGSVGDSVVRWL